MTAEQAISWLTLKPKDLPVFVLIATDPLAASTIAAWTMAAQRNGVPAKKIEGAVDVMVKCIEWKEKKLPG